MRLPLCLSLLGLLLAIGGHGSSSSAHDSNVTYFGAPRFSIEGVLPVFDIAESYIRSQTDDSVKAIGSKGNGGCSAQNPCLLGSCCNSDGQCGYRPEHCSPSDPKTCVANCDAKAPCGEFSADGKTVCPLNACCSPFGFCGTSNVFCRDTAASGGDSLCLGGNCGAIDAPSCGKNSGSASRRVAYYQSWNSRRRNCDKVWPNQLDLSGITHLVLAFAMIDPTTFQVRLMNPEDENIYKEFLALPDNVSKWIGIGGFEFSDPGPTHHAWSDMTSTQQNRKAFIDSLKQFLSIWKFRGVDIDWEWPGHESRGGNAQDGANQVELVKEMRQALGNDFGIGVVIPAQYDYMKNMDPKGLEAQVDWLTILTYDLHGAWDASIPGLGPKIKPHTDLKEIDESLKLIWSSNIDSKKINLGIANYGRGYTVTDKNCMYYGCSYTGSSKSGSCTLQDGVLSTCEIRRIINEKHLTWKVISGGAEVNEVSWDDQWIAWDDRGTLGKKLELANDRCLGGTSLWAIDYAVCPSDGGSPQPGPDSSVAPSLPASAPASSIGPSASSPVASSQATSQPSWSAPSPESSPWQDSSAASSPVGTSDAPSTPTSSAQPSSQVGSTETSVSSQSPAPWPTPSSAPVSDTWSAAPSSAPWSSPAPSWSSPAPSWSSPAPSWSSPAPSWSSPAPSWSSSAPESSAVSNNPGSSQASSADQSSSWWVSPSNQPAPSWVSTDQGSSSWVWSSSDDVPSSSSNVWSSGPGASWSTTASVSSQSSDSSAASITTESNTQASSSAGWVTTDPISQSSKTDASITTGTGSQPESSSARSGQSSIWVSTGASSQDTSAASVTSGSSSSAASFNLGSSTQAAGSSTAPQVTGSTSQSDSSAAWITTGSGSSGASSNAGSTSQAVESSDAPVVTVSASTDSTAASITTGEGSSGVSDTTASSAAGSSSGATSTNPGPVPVLPPPSTTSSDSPAPTSGQFCPDVCWNHSWCKLFCENALDWPPPRECWDFDWCVLWWGFSLPEKKDGDDPKCKLLGCGCGWMGLPWGPGCEGGSFPFPINIVIDLFGLFPDPCFFWGCNGGCGILGCDGWCFLQPGCTECPKILCPHGGPKIGPPPNGKFPPAPIPGGGDAPKPCDSKDYKTATEQMVYCGEYVDLSSAISATTISSWASTTASTSTSTSSTCHTAWDFTVLGCNVEDHKSTTTTSATKSNSLSSETPGPACTRAPLSLDDDEGNNIPLDWDLSSSIFASNTTDISSPTSTTDSTSSASPTADCDKCWQYFDKTCIRQRCESGDPSFCAYRCLSDMCLAPNSPQGCRIKESCAHPACPTEVMGAPQANVTLTLTFSNGPTLTASMTSGSSLPVSSSSFSSAPATSFEVGTSTLSSIEVGTSQKPKPTSGPMDQKGVWRVKFHLWMENNSAKIEWELYDPNENWAGKSTMDPKDGTDSIFTYIESDKNRALEHQMLFGVNAWFNDPTTVDAARLEFEIQKYVPDCDKIKNIVQCKPKVVTESRLENFGFFVDSCWQYCDKSQPEKQILKPADLNCDDMNDADWYQSGNAWQRDFNCYWKGF
ncbi:hypothetical protein BDU57DRAFT_549890 [Ampelomyces quisqualis]|uniref:chitinase n=1 Tax=Ampelomyces quisqualis TaxID=50730 RepID=A0A6A5QL73_AMPQU|nr:hypothetical protein BDU57DRAFT_549890 [Ampelomyces quisqualis]